EKVMKSLYIKFAFTTIAIMLLSGVLAFLLSNFYYQQKLKPLNDEKNTKIALDMMAFIEEQEHIKLDSYLENISDLDDRMTFVDEVENEMYFGAAFRDKDLPNKIKDNVLNSEIYDGMAEIPQEPFVTDFYANELENNIGEPSTYEGEQYAV